MQFLEEKKYFGSTVVSCYYLAHSFSSCHCHSKSFTFLLYHIEILKSTCIPKLQPTSNKFSYPHNLNQLYSVIINISGARSVVHSGSAKRMTHLVRPTSPKSPVASASAYGSLEGSDEDDVLQDDPKLDTIYLHSNGNIVSQSVAVKVELSS